MPCRPAGALPAELTSFVGRRRELADVRRSLGGGRLLTLTGMGGVGKTRLALHAAAGLGRAFPDGVRLVELGEVHDPDAVADEVASAFGLTTDARQPWTALTTFLADKRLLLVLDNCEHLLDACAVLADRLLSASEGSRILATSRQALGIPSEHVLAVAPLAIPESTGALTPEMLGQYDGVALFVDRANATVPGFTVTEENCDLVVSLCRRLDGIPLAIELTAARLRAFSLPQVLDRLADRYALLTTGNRSGPGRQRTLRTLVDWSYDLCTPPERALWSRLSVFGGGFDLAAAEAVAGDGEDVADLVAALVEKSIVVRAETDGRTRFRMLETIRQYGHDQLVRTGEERLVRARHRDWFARLAAEAEAGWAGADHLTWYERVRTEAANLRLALDFCLGAEGERQAALELAAVLCAHRRACRSLSEGRRWLDRALAEAPEPTSARAKALWVTAWLALLQGDCPAARELLDECGDIARHVADASAIAHVIQFSALADLFDGDFAAATAGFGEAIRRHEGIGDVNSARFSTLQRVMALCFAGDPTAAARVHRVKESLGTAPAAVVRGYLSWCLAVLRFVRRDLGSAAESAHLALRLAADTGERWLVALCLETSAWIAAASGEHERAARVLGAAEAVRRTIGSELSGLAYLRRHHEDCARVARAALGDGSFEAAFRSGTEVKEDQVVSAVVPDRPAAAGVVRRGGSPLTSRECEVADLVARGLTNQEIAESLVVSRRTAETHVGHILTKLGFTTRAQIAAWAAEHRASLRR